MALITESRGFSQDRRLMQLAVKDARKSGTPLHEAECFRDLRYRLQEGQVKYITTDEKGRSGMGRDAYEYGLGKLWDNFTMTRSGEFLSESEASDFRLRKMNHSNRVIKESEINTGMFSNILGQIALSATLDAFNAPEFLFSKLTTTTPADKMEREIITGYSRLKSPNKAVGEGQAYTRVVNSEEWITIPRKSKFGFIAEATMEMVRSDRTGQFVEKLNAAKEAEMYAFERQGLNVVTGVTTTYSRNGGAEQATYADSHTQGTFDNLIASNALVDPSDLKAVHDLLNKITDPNTGEPINLNGRIDLLVPMALKPEAQTISRNTTMYKVGADTAAYQAVVANPVANAYGGYGVYSNNMVYDVTQSDSTWFAGDFKGAFGYSEFMPLEQYSAGSEHPDYFDRDIVTAVKVSRIGVFYVKEPRKVVKCTA
jgi:hypothetical protein